MGINLDTNVANTFNNFSKLIYFRGFCNTFFLYRLPRFYIKLYTSVSRLFSFV